MRGHRLGVLLIVATIALGADRGWARCGDAPGDAAAVAAARAAAEAACPCDTATNHRSYQFCVARVARQRAAAGSLSRDCRHEVTRCAAVSRCGRPGALTCCRTNSNGETKCSIQKGPTCTPQREGRACSSIASSCCDACTANGCVTATRCCLPANSVAGAFTDGTSVGGAFTCELQSSAECAAQGGRDVGAGSCTPNPCVATTTSTSTTTRPTSTSTTLPLCGNHVKDPGEECDGTDFGGRTCTGSVAGAFVRGGNGGCVPHLTCRPDCTIDRSTCECATTTSTTLATTTTEVATTTTSSSTTTSTLALCGNHVKDPGEECDGTDFGGLTCNGSVAGAFVRTVVGCTPHLTCLSDCTIDRSTCSCSTTTTIARTTTSSTTTSSIRTTTTSNPPTTTSSSAPPTTSTSTSSTSSSSSTSTPTSTSTSSTIGTTTTLPTKLTFTTGTGTTSCGSGGLATNPSPPLSGELDGATSAKLKDLGAGCLYFGGGQNTVVAGGGIPDSSDFVFAITNIAGPNLTLGPSSGTSPADCTQGAGPLEHCLNGRPGTDTHGLCTADSDCNNAKGSCQPDANCFFGPPLPIPNTVIKPLSVCVVNVVATDATGTANTATGAITSAVPLSSRNYLTGTTYDTGAVQTPCPRCLNTACTAGHCAGIATGKACLNAGDCTNTCNGGKRGGLACIPIGSKQTSRDCPPNDAEFIAPLPVNLNGLTTGTSSATNANGVFCPLQSSMGSHPGAFGQNLTRTIKAIGVPAAGGIDSTPHAATLANVFCVPATGNGSIDPVADLPGPGAASFVGTVKIN